MLFVIHNLASIITGGSDFIGGQFVVTLGTEAGVTSCSSITINDDTVFEDVESFQAVLVTNPSQPAVRSGGVNVTVILIDDVCT